MIESMYIYTLREQHQKAAKRGGGGGGGGGGRTGTATMEEPIVGIKDSGVREALVIQLWTALSSETTKAPYLDWGHPRALSYLSGSLGFSPIPSPTTSHLRSICFSSRLLSISIRSYYILFLLIVSSFPSRSFFPISPTRFSKRVTVRTYLHIYIYTTAEAKAFFIGARETLFK